MSSYLAIDFVLLLCFSVEKAIEIEIYSFLNFHCLKLLKKSKGVVMLMKCMYSRLWCFMHVMVNYYFLSSLQFDLKVCFCLLSQCVPPAVRICPEFLDA